MHDNNENMDSHSLSDSVNGAYDSTMGRLQRDWKLPDMINGMFNHQSAETDDLTHFDNANNESTASNVVNVTAYHRRVSQMAVLAKFQDPVQVLRECLLTGLNTDDVRAISRAMPDDFSDNKWVHAFKAIAESR